MAPTFYEELQNVLAEINSKRPPERQVSIRSAVVNGMTSAEGKPLRDSFCSKLRAGTYRPTYDRILNLARFLGVPPGRFSLYRERYAERLIRENPEALELIEMLSQFDDRISTALLKGANKEIRRIIGAAIKKEDGPRAA